MLSVYVLIARLGALMTMGGCIGGKTVNILVEGCGLIGWMVMHWWVCLFIC